MQLDANCMQQIGVNRPRLFEVYRRAYRSFLAEENPQRPTPCKFS